MFFSLLRACLAPCCCLGLSVAEKWTVANSYGGEKMVTGTGECRALFDGNFTGAVCVRIADIDLTVSLVVDWRQCMQKLLCHLELAHVLTGNGAVEMDQLKQIMVRLMLV